MSSENLKIFSQLWKVREKKEKEKVSPNFNVSLSTFFSISFICLPYGHLLHFGASGEQGKEDKIQESFYHLLATLVKFW